MGNISLTVLASFTLLVTYSVFISGAFAATAAASEVTQNTDEVQHKRPAPAVWLKSFPVRRLKPLNSYSIYRRDLPSSDVEFFDDTINSVDKRFDDYGHLRFGKRGGEDGFDGEILQIQFSEKKFIKKLHS